MIDAPIRVLLIEDNPGDARLIREQLAEAGTAQFRMELIGSLAGSFTRLDKGEIDLILADLGLPDSQGLDTLVRLHQRASSIPIIVLTGLDDQTIGDKAVLSGAQDYLVKGQPNSETLARAIRYAIERKRTDEALLASELKYRRLFESAKDGILILDYETGTIVDINPFLLQLLGLKQEEILGKKLWDLGFFKDIAADQAKFLELQKQEFIRYDDLPLEDVNGQSKRVEFISNVYWVNSHKVIQCNIRDISERKKAAEALQDSEEKYRNVVERANDGITILQDRHIKYCNLRLAEMWGGAVEEIIGTSFLKFIQPEELPVVLDRYKRRMAGEETESTYETVLKRKDGSKLFAEISAGLIRFQGKSADLIIVRDITERKQAEEALRAREAQFRSLFENASIAICITDLQSNLLAFNDALLEMSGYDRAEIEKFGNVAAWYYDPKQREEALALFKKQGFLKNFETHLKHKDGKLCFALLSLTHTIFDGKPCIQATALDITERKQMEQALQQSEERFRVIFEKANDGITIANENDEFLVVNQRLCDILGYSREELLKMRVPDIQDPEARQPGDVLKNELARHGTAVFEALDLHRSGRRIPVEISVGPIELPSGRFYVSVIRDITKRKQAEEAVAEERNLLRTLIDNSPDYIYVKNSGGRFVVANTAVVRQMGFASEDELVGKSDWDLFPRELAARYYADEQKMIQSGERLYDYEGPTTDANKEEKDRWVSTAKVLLRDTQGKITGFVGIGRDITERKQAEERLAQDRTLLRTLIDNIPDRIYVKDTQGRKLISNIADWQGSGGKTMEDVVGKSDFDTYPPELAARFWADDQSVLDLGMQIIAREEPGLKSQGKPIWIMTTKVPLRDGNGKITGLVGVGRDITDYKQAEERLSASETELRALFAAMQDVVLVIDHDGIYRKIAPVNPALLVIPAEELLGRSLSQIFPAAEAQRFLLVLREVLATRQLAQIEYQLQIGGQTKWFSANITAMSEELTLWVAHDITNRKSDEQTIKEHLAELETLYKSGLALGQLLSPKEIAQKVIELMSLELDWHHTTIRLYHPQDESLELLAFNLPAQMSTAEFHRIEERFKTLVTKVGDGVSGWAIQHRQAVRIGDLSHDSRYIEIEPDLNSGMYIPLQIGDRIVGVVSIESELPEAFTASDERLISTLANQAAVALENARLHEETLRQLKQLQALHAIDQAITGTFDQRIILDILLTHTLSQLNADAAAIFLTQPHQRQILQYTAGKGFLTHIVEIASLKLGDSIAGEAVLKRERVHVRESEERGPQPLLSKLWTGEGFKSMDAVPLISKGEVKGIMSVFHRKEFTPDPAWGDFLETLAERAAIAIDITQLFENLQRANMELAVAYEATIEGWSQAMDLRDKETAGHTQRVTGMAVQLGKAMQLSNDEITRMRRGALLHDIGKLGVPDHILFKTEKLTDEEWLIMKKHPEFAYDMLHPIAYLNLSLDIPYSHHEKWDGTGYPQGLKGQQIPLAARIFAIIDVWDALTSDRPYRKAWSKPETLQYLREQSGIYFDPEVVDAFLKEFANE